MLCLLHNLRLTWASLRTSTCTAVRDAIMKLWDEAPAEHLFNEDQFEQVIRTAETGLMTTFTIFDVGGRVPVFAVD